jgi:hypothetical protein
MASGVIAWHVSCLPYAVHATPPCRAVRVAPNHREQGSAIMMGDASTSHRIIVVGGSAGGLELVTRLGDKLGRRKLADGTTPKSVAPAST